MEPKEVFYKIHSTSFGDTLAATPTLRRLFYAYSGRINVVTHSKKCFLNNPYIKRLLSFEEYESLIIQSDKKNFEVLESFVDAGIKNQRGIEKKFATMDLRNSHSMDLGFELTPEQRSYDFFPEDYSEEWELPESYVVLHVTSNWANRTWDKKYWDSVVTYLAKNKIFTVTIGMDYQETLHQSVSKEPLVKKCPTFENLYGLDLTNKGSLDDMWHVINRADCIVTMDSGPLHLAGSTDCYIIQIGSALNWRFRAPYRKGKQEHKYKFIGGTCPIFCNNDLIYSVREWGTINSVPPLDGCLENKPTFECHPTPSQVINAIEEIFPVSDKNILDSGFKKILGDATQDIAPQLKKVERRETGEFKSFQYLGFSEGEIRFSIKEDLEGELRIECFDLTTGLRRDVYTTHNPKKIEVGHYWWVPSPGNDSEIKKKLGPVRLEIYENQNISGEILIPEEGGKEISIGKNKIKFPLINDNLYPTFWEIFIKREYDFSHGIKKGGVVIDIGANYGFYSLFCLDNFKPSSVHLVEPNPQCHLAYGEIFKGLEECNFYQIGITEKSGKYSIINDSGISAVSRMVFDESGDISCEDINTFLSSIEGDIEILKVDCEGDEKHIFEQISEDNLNRIYNIGVEYHDEEIMKQILGRLGSSGFVYEVKPTSSTFGIILASKMN